MSASMAKGAVVAASAVAISLRLGGGNGSGGLGIMVISCHGRSYLLLHVVWNPIPIESIQNRIESIRNR